MKLSLKIEECAMLNLGIFLFTTLDYSRWWFAGLFLVPDIGMLGYLASDKTGAYSYNIFHRKGIAVAIYLTGIMLFAHSSFDRCFGYGLKYEKGFKFTHLGEIGT
ncbi:DUF4260 domain-containing protein [Christiangramia sp. OXR-203]|jgi:hypothetical protein|uniref:DUF4260 domain-containing protein n=1 Tax=Christiangramia sp. OXR-203 TaxID=3100176 RepID=UPI002AC932B3|nr:DUF4260 domain-containing protein [Christiangramia sp. OXR-203]WPY98330.1 DUF4260 domain-containing protein [Christiangramia sp. OXR-203]